MKPGVGAEVLAKSEVLDADKKRAVVYVYTFLL